jgi:hypothetical protein
VTEPIDEVITKIPESQPSSVAPSSNASSSQPEQTAIYTVTANPDTYETTASQVTVLIKNTSQVEGGYGRSYRIERKTDSGWTPLPLEIVVTDDWIILPAGETQEQSYNLHQDQHDYIPGTYRIVFADGLNDATAEFSMLDVNYEPGPGQANGEPAYEVKPKLSVYDANTEAIPVSITNISNAEGGYGHHYRIEEKAGETWTPLPLEIIVTEEWLILPAGETQEQTYNLFRDQFDYIPGTTYRIVLTGVAGEPSVMFQLE